MSDSGPPMDDAPLPPPLPPPGVVSPNWVPSAEHPVPPLVSWTDIYSIYQTVAHLGTTLGSVQQQIANMQATDTANVQTLKGTSDTVAQLVTELKGVAAAVDGTPKGTTPSGTPSSGTPKFKEPRVFDGKGTSVVPFLQEIKNAVYLSRRSLATEKDKCVYLSTYLGNGSPREWYNSIDIQTPELLNDFDKFTDDFKKHFGDSNIVATAQNKIDEIHQTGSAAQYVARLNEWIYHLELSEATKIQYVYRHLKSSVKDAITLVPKENRPKTYKAYGDFAIEIDNRLHEREREKKKDSRTTNRPRPLDSKETHDTPSQSIPELPAGEPMEIDATRISKPRGPLTE
ncbi:hypothetical protein MPER_13098, partial [Moniliophthora perniciosa FA553]